MGLHGARRLAWLPAVAVLSVLAGCQSGGSTMGVVPASAPPGAIVPPAGSPISVTVAPAVVAPGATQTSMPVPSLVAVAPRPAPYVAPCGRYPSPKQIPLQVSPGSGSAVVGWLSDGDSTVRSYRVSAISQQLVAGNQPAPPTVTTARGVSCGPLRISFTGLQHGAGYVFWLEEGDPDPAGGLRYWQVGQTAGVLVP
jgi:hypothetical protein